MKAPLLDATSKFFLVLFAVLAFFFLYAFVVSAVFREPFGFVLMNFSTSSLALANVSGVLISCLLGFFLSRQLPVLEPFRVFETILQAVSLDERAALQEIRSAKAISQDSLRFRLNWSKAKASVILSKLDKKGLIVRERSGKTYKIFLPQHYESSSKDEKTV